MLKLPYFENLDTEQVEMTGKTCRVWGFLIENLALVNDITAFLLKIDQSKCRLLPSIVKGSRTLLKSLPRNLVEKSGRDILVLPCQIISTFMLGHFYRSFGADVNNFDATVIDCTCFS